MLYVAMNQPAKLIKLISQHYTKIHLNHMDPNHKSLYLHQGMSLKQQQHKIKIMACQTEQQMR